VIIQIDEGVI